MKIAIIGTGISGLSAAYFLQRSHEVTVYEAENYVGGHTHTVDVEVGGRSWAVDTGFIVFNDWTYPNFIRLLDELGVGWHFTDMSFSVRDDETGFEYMSLNFSSWFAQRRNLLKLSVWRMFLDIARFNKEITRAVDHDEIDPGETLETFLMRHGYSEQFMRCYVTPLGAAIWSASSETMSTFPVRFFARFLRNHGMLSVNERPDWRVVDGGSRSYIKPLTRGFADRIRISAPVEGIRREEDRVWVTAGGFDPEAYDAVVIATHSDQALAMLSDPTDAEREVLGALPYQPNDTALHTDASFLPRCKRAWASWNSFLPKGGFDRAVLTYDMNNLQGLDAPETFCVSLNDPRPVAPEKLIRRLVYHHPIYTSEGTRAQERHAEISGPLRTHYAGAYWFNGFHEDGLRSGLRVAADLGEAW